MTGKPRPVGAAPWGRLAALQKHPLITAAVTLIALLAGIATMWDTINGPDGPQDLAGPAVTTTSSSVGGPSPTTPAVATSAAASSAVGACLSVDGTPAPCDGSHAGEVFSDDGDCSPTALLGYLGGAQHQDVLRDAEISSVSSGDGTYCAVTGPPDALGSGNADILLSPAGDRWRRCEDQLQRQTSCSEPHVAEVIFERTEGTEALDCPRRADEYLGSPFERRSADLELLQDDRRCLIAVRSDNVLTSSLRRLGSSSLPLAAPSS